MAGGSTDPPGGTSLADVIDISLTRHLTATVDKLVELVDFLPNVRKIEVTSREEKDGKIKLVNVWHGGGEVPAAVRAFLSEGMLSWTDYAEWEQATWTVKWKSESHSFKNAVDSR